MDYEKARRRDRCGPPTVPKFSTPKKKPKPANSSIYEAARNVMLQELKAYDGDFEFLLSMRKKAFVPGFEPTWSQIEAVSKCLRRAM